MTAQEMKSLIHDFLNAWVEGNTAHVLKVFTEDSVWTTPQGTFQGLGQIENYLKWPVHTIKDYKIIENGIGILVEGNSAVIEHDLAGIINGNHFRIPACCVWEFNNGKVAKLRTYFDVLAQAQQVAGGGAAKIAVNTVVKASQKGLK